MLAFSYMCGISSIILLKTLKLFFIMYNLIKQFTQMSAPEILVFTDLTSVHCGFVGSKRDKAMLLRQDIVAMDVPILNLPRLLHREY